MKVNNFHQDHLEHIYIEVFEKVDMKGVKNSMLNQFKWFYFFYLRLLLHLLSF